MKRVLLSLTIVLILLAACSAPQKSLADELLGTWMNTDGYTIEFQPAGNGFIPGVPGKIPDSKFIYSIRDDSHIVIEFEGHESTIEILIDEDQLTWKDDLGVVSYTRVK